MQALATHGTRYKKLHPDRSLSVAVLKRPLPRPFDHACSTPRTAALKAVSHWVNRLGWLNAAKQRVDYALAREVRWRESHSWRTWLLVNMAATSTSGPAASLMF